MPTPFDLMIAPTGARLQKRDHPALPVSVDEITATAQRCEHLGASSIHVHVRDNAGRHSLDPERYNDLLRSLQTHTALHIQISTEAADLFDLSAQHACLRGVHANDTSLSLREMSASGVLSRDTYRLAADRGIDVQHILYSADEVATLLNHFDTGAIPKQNRRAIFVLGRYTSDRQSAPPDLLPFLKQMGQTPLNWAVCAFGQREHDCLLAALDAGGNVRLGFENNCYAPDGTQFADNAASVAAFVERAARKGFTPNRGPS